MTYSMVGVYYYILDICFVVTVQEKVKNMLICQIRWWEHKVGGLQQRLQVSLCNSDAI